MLNKTLMDEVLAKAKAIVTEYGQGKLATLDLLFNANRKLLGYNYYLAEELAKLNYKYNESIYTRKIVQAESFNNYKNDLNNKITNELAKNKSVLVVADMLKEECERGLLYERLKLTRSQINRITSAITQEISHLKQENNNLITNK